MIPGCNLVDKGCMLHDGHLNRKLNQEEKEMCEGNSGVHMQKLLKASKGIHIEGNAKDVSNVFSFEGHVLNVLEVVGMITIKQLIMTISWDHSRDLCRQVFSMFIGPISLRSEH
ncbi:hypothetical protein VNO78_09829 [Psophocarpus tetragonolobus]|uniref:Uncharacterized protein n=1 Tax=Psophocarpus tetragonolobus TaxID=3891 RepID=A0AAN9XTH1_PSOTE